jgi:hypothetical protein
MCLTRIAGTGHGRPWRLVVTKGLCQPCSSQSRGRRQFRSFQERPKNLQHWPTPASRPLRHTRIPARFCDDLVIISAPRTHRTWGLSGVPQSVLWKTLLPDLLAQLAVANQPFLVVARGLGKTENTISYPVGSGASGAPSLVQIESADPHLFSIVKHTLLPSTRPRHTIRSTSWVFSQSSRTGQRPRLSTTGAFGLVHLSPRSPVA